MRLVLHEDGPSPALPARALRAVVEPLLPPSVGVELRGDLVAPLGTQEREALARELARVRVRRAEWRAFDHEPFPPEVAYELRVLGREARASALPYDGWELVRIYRDLLPREERVLDIVHVVVTHRLPATFEDGRYHARVCVLGFPHVLSTRGIVEGPAKPREFYLRKQQADLLGGGPSDLLLKDFEGRFVADDDPRLPLLLRGYVLAAVRHQATGEAWCARRDCMLYNAHWQEELLAAQLGGQLCPEHGEAGRLALGSAEASAPERAGKR